MPELHETRIGMEFFRGTVPRALKALEDIAEQLGVVAQELYKIRRAMEIEWYQDVEVDLWSKK